MNSRIVGLFRQWILVWLLTWIGNSVSLLSPFRSCHASQVFSIASSNSSYTGIWRTPAIFPFPFLRWLVWFWKRLDTGLWQLRIMWHWPSSVFSLWCLDMYWELLPPHPSSARQILLRSKERCCRGIISVNRFPMLFVLLFCRQYTLRIRMPHTILVWLYQEYALLLCVSSSRCRTPSYLER